MNFNQNERYEGFVIEPITCESGESRDFALYFSLKVERVEDERLFFSKPNPAKIVQMLQKKEEFYLIGFEGNKKLIARMRLEDMENMSALVLERDITLERRRYDRFNLCPEDLGSFTLYTRGTVRSSAAYIEDISVAGIRVALSDDPGITGGEKIELRREKNHFNLFFELETVNVQRGGRVYVSGRITESSVSVAKLISEIYLRKAKKILMKD